MRDDYARLRAHLLACQERVVQIQSALVGLPAISPENGGQGEERKAQVIEQCLRAAGITDILHADARDERAPGGLRPNIIARIPGRTKRTLWLFGHMDVVPAGDESCWDTSPWVLRREGDLLYGRGVEDNQQAIASMLILAESLSSLGIQPEIGLGMVFMADEECGSAYGLKHVLKQYPHIFKSDDFYIVPDGGSRSGLYIEIAEKAQLWIKFVLTGRQCHASAPQNGKNSFLAASGLVLALQKLYELFPEKDDLFKPAFSTFVPTRHDGNDVCVNILPGKDIFYLDCRILPGISIESVKEAIRDICAEVSGRYGNEVSVEYVQFQPASSTSPQASIMDALKSAIQDVYEGKARPVGIGGATVASMLRGRALPAVVWARIMNTCHQPNEVSSIANTCGDAAVFAHILMDGSSQDNA